VWNALIDLYGINGFAIAVRGIPYDDISRWRVFKNPKFIDVVSTFLSVSFFMSLVVSY
jgi:hypothetical protein